MDNERSIFHARVGKFVDNVTLGFGDVIDLPYATDQFSLEDLSEEEVINLHKPIMAGIWALTILGMDDAGIIIYEDSGTHGARFEVASFSWRETPKYLVFDDKGQENAKLILEITHDDRTRVDEENIIYRREHPLVEDVNQEPAKTRIVPLSKWSPGSSEAKLH